MPLLRIATALEAEKYISMPCQVVGRVNRFASIKHLLSPGQYLGYLFT